MENSNKYKGKVLVIDDTIAIIDMVKAALMSHGYQILIATTGTNGIKSAKISKPDLILLDILMPEIDGYETCELLKKDESTKDIPVLFMSALTDVFDKVKAFDVGAVDYVTKPLNLEELLARVNTQISLHKLQKQLKQTNEILEEKVDERTKELRLKNLEIKEKYEELLTAEEEIRATNEELRNAHSIISDSERKYRVLTESLPDVILTIDKSYRISYINKSLGELKKESISKKTIFELEHHTAGKESLKNKIDSVFKNGKPVIFEKLFKSPSSELFLRVKVNPIFTADRIDNLVLIITDLSKEKQLEKDIAESRERFELAMNASHDGLFDLNLVNNEIYYSPGWKFMLGYKDNELENKVEVWEKLTPAEDVERTWKLLNEHIEGKRDKFESEFMMKHKNGSWVNILARGNAIFNEKGDAVRVVGTHIDMTERKKAEEMLRTTQMHYTDFINHSNDAVIYWKVPDDFEMNMSIDKQIELLYNLVCVDANRTTWENLGFKNKEELIGLRYQDIVQERTIDEKFRLFIENGYKLNDFENYHNLKNYNDYFSLENWFGVIKDGKLAYLWYLSKNITHTKAAERALKESEERFKAFMKFSPIHAYIKDHTHINIYQNKPIKDFLGIEANNNKSSTEIFTQEINQLLEEAEHEILDQNRPYKTLEYSTIINQEEKWLKDIKFPIRMSDQKTLVGGVAIDITEQKKHEKELEKHKQNLEILVKERTDELEASNEELVASNEELHKQKDSLKAAIKELNETQHQLIQSEKMASLGVLVAGVAHEINNPINFINSSLAGLKKNLTFLLTYTDLYSQITEDSLEILEQIKALEKQADINQVINMFKRSIEIIEVGIERTTKIVQGLKAFARSDEKKLGMYNIDENIDNTLLILYNQYKNRIKIEKRFSETPLIECYPGQINQVIMNILNNAIQSIKDKGTIHIQTSTLNHNKVLIEIKDDGLGIPEEIKNKIFDPFFTTKKVGMGTGLGLSITYNIVKEHDGTIDVESEEGKGSTFRITLPIKKQKLTDQ